MKVFLFAFLSISVFNQLNSAPGDYGAYSTLLKAFTLKVKSIDKETNWRAKLEPFFALPQKEIKVLTNSLNYTQQVEEIITVKNKPKVENLCKQFISRSQITVLCDLISTNTAFLSEDQVTISNIYREIYKRITIEPKASVIDGFVGAFANFNKKKTISQAHLSKIQNELNGMEQFLIDIKGKLNKQSKSILDTHFMKQIKKFEKNFNMYQGRGKFNSTQTPIPIIDELVKIQSVLKHSLEAIESVLIEYDLQRIRWAEILMDTKLCEAGQELTIVAKLGNWLRSLSFIGIL